MSCQCPQRSLVPSTLERRVAATEVRRLLIITQPWRVYATGNVIVGVLKLVSTFQAHTQDPPSWTINPKEVKSPHELLSEITLKNETKTSSTAQFDIRRYCEGDDHTHTHTHAHTHTYAHTHTHPTCLGACVCLCAYLCVCQLAHPDLIPILILPTHVVSPRLTFGI